MVSAAVRNQVSALAVQGGYSRLGFANGYYCQLADVIWPRSIGDTPDQRITVGLECGKQGG